MGSVSGRTADTPELAAGGAGGLDVRVLGGLELRVDGELIPLRGRLRRRLLLALLSSRAVSAEDIATALWPERRVDDATVNSVHAQVSRLRRLLDADGSGRASSWLASEGPHYRLRPTSVDAERLEAQIATAEALAATDPARAREILSAVRAAAARPVEEDLDSWSTLAAHWRMRFLQSEETWADLVVGSPEVAAHADDLLGLARAEPTREIRWALAMRALALAGRQTEALAVYREARDRLVDEVGVEPGPDLRLTHDAVLRQAQLGRSGWGPAAGPPAQPATAFVGRQDDLAVLDDAVAGHRIVTVHGLGGMGKSRLVAEWATRSGRSGSTHWVDLRGAHADRVVHRVAAQLGLAPDEDSERAGLHAILLTTPALPVVVVLDDVDAAAEGVAPLVLTLVSSLPQLTVILTARRTLGITGERALLLGPLADVDAERLAELRAGGVGPVATAIARRSGGLPLVIEVLTRADAAGPTTGAGDLHDAVQEAVRELPPDSAEVLHSLGVLPGGATVGLLGRLAPGAPGPVLRRVARDLVGSALVVTDARLGPDGQPALRHVVLQPVVDALDTGPVRDRAWAAFGGWLVEHLPARYGDPPDWHRVRTVGDELVNLDGALAHWAAVDPRRLLDSIITLGPWWNWSGQSSSGHRWAETALRALGDDVDPAARSRALALQSTGRGLGHLAASADRLDEAVRILRPDADPGLRAGVLGTRAVARGWAGDLPGFAEDLAEARRSSAIADRPWLDLHLDSAEALSRAARGEAGEAIGDLLVVSGRFGELGDTHAATVSIHFALTIAGLVGDPRAEQLLALGLESAARDGSPAARALIAGEAAKHGLRRALVTDASDAGLVERLERAAADLERVGNGRTAAVVRRDLGLHLLRAGEQDRAEGQLRTAAERLLVLDPGAAALAVAALASLGGRGTRARLAKTAWALAFAGGTPVLDAELRLLEELTRRSEPPPASHAPPTEAVRRTVEEALAVLDIPRLDLGA